MKKVIIIELDIDEEKSKINVVIDDTILNQQEKFLATILLSNIDKIVIETIKNQKVSDKKLDGEIA